MSYNRKYKLELPQSIVQVFPCSICRARGQGSYKVMTSASETVWWWADSVCSEECFNLWLLKQ